MNRPGQVAGVLPVKRPRQAGPRSCSGSSSAPGGSSCQPALCCRLSPAFISRHLGDGSLGIGWAYFLYSAASIAIRPWAGRYPHAAGHGQ